EQRMVTTRRIRHPAAAKIERGAVPGAVVLQANLLDGRIAELILTGHESLSLSAQSRRHETRQRTRGEGQKTKHWMPPGVKLYGADCVAAWVFCPLNGGSQLFFTKTKSPMIKVP